MMRTKVKTTILTFLLLLGVWGCNESNDDEYGFKAPVTEEINSFFNDALPQDESSNCFFTTLDLLKDTCYVINSNKELDELYSGEKNLPIIDFDKYTLILGKTMESAGYAIEGHNIEITDNFLIITLTIKQLEGSYTQQFVPCYYWGLYKKLPFKEYLIKKEYSLKR